MSNNQTSIHCPNYHYLNTTSNSCQLCADNQDTNGYITWTIALIMTIFAVCFCCFKLFCPLLLTVIIGSNQITCNRHWSESVVRMLFVLEFILIIISIAIIKFELKK